MEDFDSLGVQKLRSHLLALFLHHSIILVIVLDKKNFSMNLHEKGHLITKKQLDLESCSKLPTYLMFALITNLVKFI